MVEPIVCPVIGRTQSKALSGSNLEPSFESFNLHARTRYSGNNAVGGDTSVRFSAQGFYLGDVVIEDKCPLEALLMAEPDNIVPYNTNISTASLKNQGVPLSPAPIQVKLALADKQKLLEVCSEIKQTGLPLTILTSNYESVFSKDEMAVLKENFSEATTILENGISFSQGYTLEQAEHASELVNG